MSGESAPVEKAEDLIPSAGNSLAEDSDADQRYSDNKNNSEKRNGSSKRKRDDAPELEIDVNLPEPPSKKALRKSKKQKPNGAQEEGSMKRAEEVNDDSDPEATAKSTKIAASAERSVYGIWIGNLAFTITKSLLQTFFTAPSTGITPAQITRINIPAPKHAAATKTTLKPQNKGFAYVDFADREGLDAAIKLSETEFAGRKVLIKDAKSFEGRPEKPKEDNGQKAKDPAKENKPPARRVFVGNLSFDVTKEDLTTHYQQCGEIEDVHMATFEDSGKCKGFAWVRFTDVEAAEAAVRGWIRKKGDDDQGERDDHQDGNEIEDNETAKSKTAKKDSKGRKWFVNRLFGRPLRCEFAEDPSVRYRKRFGKEKEDNPSQAQGDPVEMDESQERAVHSRAKSSGRRGPAVDNEIHPGAPTDPSKRRGRTHEKASGIKEAGEYRSNEEARYRTGGITEGTGKKTTFD